MMVWHWSNIVNKENQCYSYNLKNTYILLSGLHFVGYETIMQENMNSHPGYDVTIYSHGFSYSHASYDVTIYRR